MTQYLKKILTGTETEKFVFYRDLKPKRLRTTAVNNSKQTILIYQTAHLVFVGLNINIKYCGTFTSIYLGIRKQKNKLNIGKRDSRLS